MQLTLAEFDDIRRVVHDLCGIVISDDKQYLVKSRLEPIVRAQGFTSYELLVRRLKQANSLLLQEQIIEAITTSETSFNRDGHPFAALRRFILPELSQRLLQRKAASRMSYARARIWCAAVATGQEAYSVAMAVHDFLAGPAARGLTAEDFPILATDISGKSLMAAKAGRYSAAEVDRGVTAEQRSRYFRREDGGWVVHPALRGMIEFRRLNLVQSFPEMGPFDLILCRNLLIYLDGAARERLCRGLFAALSPRGILMIGAAESLIGVTDAFSKECLGQTVVYRKP